MEKQKGLIEHFCKRSEYLHKINLLPRINSRPMQLHCIIITGILQFKLHPVIFCSKMQVSEVILICKTIGVNLPTSSLFIRSRTRLLIAHIFRVILSLTNSKNDILFIPFVILNAHPNILSCFYSLSHVSNNLHIQAHF